MDLPTHKEPSDLGDGTQRAGLGKSNVQVNEDSESDVEEVYDKSPPFMASKGTKEGSAIRNMSLYEQWKETVDDD